jgi:hypothetical protein
MRLQSRLPAVLLLVIALGACSPPVTVVTQPGKVAFTADQIAVRVNELESAAITGNSVGALSIPNTRTIVQFTVSADKILSAVPAGWQQSIATSWVETKKQLPPTLSPNVATAVAAVDLVLAAFIQP